MSYVIAGVLVVGLGAWLASGMVGEDEPAAPERTAAAEPVPPLVEVSRSEAAPVTLHIVAQGDVRAFRTAAARAEAAGRIDELLVEVGERVEAGQPVARLTQEGRGSSLRAAEAVLEQRQADYEAAASLLENGFVTEARVRELRTQLESARQEVVRLSEALENTSVTAPFDGIVNALPVAEGEFVSVNAEIATLIDNSPLRVDVRVNQQDVGRIPAGGPARVAFATGATEVGRVCFVSASADPQTRTFRVEVRAPNAGNELPSGISAEVNLPTGEAMAHFISPAILSLGPDGTLGVKTVAEDGAVTFHSVDVVRAQTDGVWVSGLPDVARIITIGQGFVQAGDAVRIAEAEAAMAAPEGAVANPVPPDPAICNRNATGGEGAGEVAGANGTGDGETGAIGAGDATATGAPSGEVGESAERPGAAATAGETTTDPTDGAATADAGPVTEPSTVRQVQQALNELGYDAGTPDGLLGDQTLTALRDWRADNGLEPAATLDRATIARLLDGGAGRAAGPVEAGAGQGG